MAGSGELKHKDAGTQLTSVEDNATDRHVLDSQAKGDIVYASETVANSGVLTRLGIGATDTILSVQGGVPTWRTPANILTDLSGQAGASFNWNGQPLDNIAYLIDNSANPATSGGFIRIGHGGTNILVGRNNANNANAGLLDWGLTTTDILTICPGTYGIHLNGTITLNATVYINGQHFECGADRVAIDSTSSQPLDIISTQDGADGVIIYTQHVSANPAVDDRTLQLVSHGMNDASQTQYYGRFGIRIESAADGAEAGKYYWETRIAAAWNMAMTLSSVGQLSVDINASATYADDDHPVAVHDRWNDIVAVNRAVKKQEFDMLLDMEVFTRKDTGSGYMMNVQNAIYLGWNVSRQIDGKLNDLIGVLVEEFPQVAKKLSKRNLIGLPIGRD